MKDKPYYPSWRYHKSKAALVVENEVQSKQMAKEGYGKWSEIYGDKQEVKLSVPIAVAEIECPVIASFDDVPMKKPRKGKK